MGGSTQKAPTPFQPPNQAGSAAAFQQGAGQLSSQGSALYNSVAPQLSQISTNVASNPYYAQALQGSQAAASQATGSVAPQQFAGASQDADIAALAGGAAPSYASTATTGGVNAYNQTQSLLPAATSGASLAPGALAQAESLIPSTTQGANFAPGAIAQTQAMIPQATSGAGLAQGAYDQTQALIPSATQGASIAPDVLAGLAAGGIQTYGTDMTALNNLGTTGLQAGNTVLNTGFDPQNALYNQQYQQQLDQQNAINAMNGVSGSPYAAGVSGQESRQFNTDWENQQLNRQISALGAYDQAASTYAGDTANLSSGAINNLATGVNSGVNDFNSLTGQAVNNLDALQATGTNDFNALNNSAVSNLDALQTTGVNNYDALTGQAVSNLSTLQNTGVGNFNALNNSAVSNAANLIGTGNSALDSGINTGVGALSTLGNEAIAGNQGASDLGTAGLNTLAGAAQLPSDIYTQQQQAELAALGAQISGSNAASAQQQTGVGDQGSYLNIGQTASSGAIQAAQVNNQAAQAQANGFGNLFGSVLGMFSFGGGGGGSSGGGG